MKTLLACECPPEVVEQLRALAAELVYRPDITAPELRDAIADVSILVVGNLRVSPDVVTRGKSLQLIVHAGPGPGEIAVDEASAAGVFVCDCPSQHATAVAELTLGLMLALDRRIVENTVALREGRWIRGSLPPGQGLAGRTLGILGYGDVGRLVAQRARACDMHVLAWTPQLSTDPRDADLVEFRNWPRELAREADIVTIHALGEDDRAVLVDAEFLQSMKPGAALVHVGQVGAVDEAALAEAIQQRKLRVALDVFASEPTVDHGRFRCRLCDLPDVIGTQHVGPLTEQAHRATADEVLRIIRSFVVSGDVVNCLNICERSPATWQLVLRVRDQVGVMASVLEAIRSDGINAEEITSRVFAGAKAAWFTIALDERPSTEALETVRNLSDVLHLELRAVV